MLDPSEEPKRIRKVHTEEVEFVKSWLHQWSKRKVYGLPRIKVNRMM